MLEAIPILVHLYEALKDYCEHNDVPMPCMITSCAQLTVAYRGDTGSTDILRPLPQLTSRTTSTEPFDVELFVEEGEQHFARVIALFKWGSHMCCLVRWFDVMGKQAQDSATGLLRLRWAEKAGVRGRQVKQMQGVSTCEQVLQQLLPRKREDVQLVDATSIVARACVVPDLAANTRSSSDDYFLWNHMIDILPLHDQLKYLSRAQSVWNLLFEDIMCE